MQKAPTEETEKKEHSFPPFYHSKPGPSTALV